MSKNWVEFSLGLFIIMSPTRSPADHASLWQFVSENALVSGILVAIVIPLLGWLFKVWRDRRDSQTIFDFLRDSPAGSGYTFRTTHAIAAATHIPETPVAELCSRDSRIARNEKEAQTWRLA